MAGFNIAAFGFLGAVVAAVLVGGLFLGLYLGGRLLCRKAAAGFARTRNRAVGFGAGLVAAGVFDVITNFGQGT